MDKPPHNNARVQAYPKYRHGQHQAVLSAAHGRGINAALRHSFTDSINGFTVELSQKQAQALAELPQVEYVQRSQLRPLQTDRGPKFIGAQSVWTGGASSGLPYQGEGVIVGVLDSGINTDHVSFAASGGGIRPVNPFGAGHYLGDCANMQRHATTS